MTTYSRIRTLRDVIVRALTALLASLLLALGLLRTAAAGDPAGAQSLPDLQFLHNEPAACTHYVAESGNDNFSGTISQPWRTVRKALLTLQAGQVGCVDSGNYVELAATPTNSGTFSQPIVLKRKPGSATRPVIHPYGPVAVFNMDKSYWIIDGFDVDMRDYADYDHDGDVTERLATAGFLWRYPAQYGVLRNSILHHSSNGVNVYITGSDFLLEGNEVHTNFRYDGSDSHGVLVPAEAAATGGAHRILIRHNSIHDNGGDGFQCESDNTYTDNPSTDMTLEDNVMFTSSANWGYTEQAVDIKSCHRITLRGSVQPGVDGNNALNTYYDFRVSSGTAVVFHFNASDILLENTLIATSCGGLIAGIGDNRAVVVRNLVIRNNVFRDMIKGSGQCAGHGIEFDRVNQADVRGNVFARLPGVAFSPAKWNVTGLPNQSVTFYDNQVSDSGRWMYAFTDTTMLWGFVSDWNVYWNSNGSKDGFIVDTNATQLPGWQSKGGSAAIAVADPNSANTAPGVPLCRVADPSHWSTKAIDPVQTGSFVVDGDVSVDSATSGGAFAVASGDPVANEWDKLAAIVLFDYTSGTVKVRDGANYVDAPQPLHYLGGTNYHVRLEIDVPNRTYRALVSPQGSPPVLLGEQLKFRDTQSQAVSLDHIVIAAAAGHVQGCNFGLVSTTPTCSVSRPSGGWTNSGFPVQLGEFNAQFDVTPSLSTMDGVVGISNGAQTAFTGFAALVAFDSSGHITARNGSDYPASNISYVVGVRYRFRLDINLATHTYSAYVTPSGGAELLIGANYAFRTEQGSVQQLNNVGATVAGSQGTLTLCDFLLLPTSSMQVHYGYMPPVQYVGGGLATYPVPSGYIHQTAWDQGGGPDVEGVYTYDIGSWKSLVWRWADTMRSNAIQKVAPGPATAAPTYRFELAPTDHASPGTAGDHPRAEFFSVDPEEDRRMRVPPRENVIRQGDEYWATFALYLPADFPLNHRWATLVQRKFQDGVVNPSPWFSINVHMDNLDYGLPLGVVDDYRLIDHVSNVRGHWLQFAIHEKASAYSDGLFELYVNGALRDRKTGPTIDPGDINYNFHLGYYRANEAADGQFTGPGVGVVYESPLLIWRGANADGIGSAPILP